MLWLSWLSNQTRISLLDLVRCNYSKINLNYTLMKTLQGDAIRNITGSIATPTPANASIFASNRMGGIYQSNRTPPPTRHYKSGTLEYPNLGSVCTSDTSRQVSTAPENRPNNFNIKLYIKI